MEGAPPSIVLTPATDQAEIARDWLERYDGTGIDGVVAKRLDLLYQPGRRAMIKVKKERTADCVVAGVRVALDGGEASVASLLLGLYDGGSLRHVGVCSTFTALRRRELFAELRPRIVPLEGHPWERGFNLGRSPTGRLKGSAGRWDPAEMTQDWVPVEPDLVCEVRYDRLDADRFRHPAKFLRWRPDREAGSCRFEQFAGRAPRDGAADRTSEPPWS
jgi:ATP-dependent DNA ligase